MYASNAVPYILFFLVSVLLFMYQQTFKNRGAVIAKSVDMSAFYLCFVSLIIFLGCRGYLAADWLIYLPHYNGAATLYDGFGKMQGWLGHNLYTSEPGYSVFVMLCKSIFNNYLAFQFICFCMDVCLLHIFFKTYCPKYYFLCWAFYWIFLGYVFEIITLRNTKSILLFAISIKYINEHKPIRYFSLMFIALLFHSSSIFYFPLYFLNRVKRNKRVEILMFLCGLVVCVFQIQWLQKVLLSCVDVFPGRYNALLKNYLGSKHFSSAYGITIGFIERFFTFILFFCYSNKILKKEPHLTIIWYLYLLYIAIFLFCSEFYIIIERIPNLFVCSYWILYTKLYENIHRKSWRYVFLVLLILYGVFKTLILLDEKWAYYENFLFHASDADFRARYYTY